MNLNKAMVIGNLTRDPEIKTIPSGATVAAFSVATSFVWKDQTGQKQEKVEYHNIVAWKRLAEIVGQYLKKGSKVYIEGRLQTRDWTGQDGVKKYRTEIIAENMIMLDRAGAGNYNAGGGNTFAANKQNQEAEPVINVDEQSPSEETIRVEDIPF